MVCLRRPSFTSIFHRTIPCRPSLHHRHHHQLPILGSNQEPRRSAARFGRKAHVIKPLASPALESSSLTQESTGDNSTESGSQVLALCGFGYWVQGFRCFPWLALNFHLVHALNLSPATLQLVQNTGNLPMVAKPLLGVISDALYIGDAHRLPYISIGGPLSLSLSLSLSRSFTVHLRAFSLCLPMMASFTVHLRAFSLCLPMMASFTVQLVQNTGNLPMQLASCLKLLSFFSRGDHNPTTMCVSFAVVLQLVSWGTLASIPVTGETFPTQVTCILLSNLGASFAEVATDALVAEFSRTRRSGELQSHAFIALAAGAMLGNLSGGFLLLKTQEPQILFVIFALLLSAQLALSLTTKETSICLPQISNHHPLVRSSLSENLSKQFSNLITAIHEESIFYPLSWIVASVAVVPILSGSMFCFQTQCLKIDPAVIGLSKVIGQLVVLSAAFFYERYLKRLPMRRLICGAQILYALSLLSDLILVKQVNVKLGISNEACVLCLSALAEAIAQFKMLPFSVLFSRLFPSGCEGSLFAFFASAMCLSSILGGIFGVGLASLIGVTSEDYSSMAIGILVQFVAALVPLGWISCIPITRSLEEMRMPKRRRAA
ncbi:hypothetical protein B296_00008330 [Ensete ventricosum]|uniref:Uncharacterized protein n=1 Tax=Ensete ventricosum TaxID=4639 RepID=A0A426YNC5_ENSVE|nr:hypothetical protein B296_00008330 [Ensete ventricosum]